LDDRIALDAVLLSARRVARYHFRKRQILAVRKRHSEASAVHATSELRDGDRNREHGARPILRRSFRQLGLLSGLRRLFRLVPLPLGSQRPLYADELEPIDGMTAFRIALAAGDEELHDEQEAERDSERDTDRKAV